ncbi:MAG TPA: threonine/serine dehydratase, partial [Candidatus Thermoplasmatota archaeon]
MPPTLELERFTRARERISGAVHRTPVLSSQAISRRAGIPVRLKAEHLQKTGSFKTRGALNCMLALGPEARSRGVVTISAGNHAQAVAWAAARVGARAKVVMPAAASPTKARASAEYGAEVVLHGTALEAFQKAFDLAREEGLTFVHPFDDEEVLAGQGTVGLEIAEDVPDAATVVIPVGGGGLCAGTARALSHVLPRARVWGVEPEGAAAMALSLDGGAPVRLETVSTIADGLAAPMAGELTYPLIRDHCEGVVTVTDDEIASALALV